MWRDWARWLVHQEEWQFPRSVRVALAAVAIALAGAMLTLLLADNGWRVQVGDLVGPAVFATLGLVLLLAKTPRVCAVGFAVVLPVGMVGSWVVSKATWRDVVGWFIWTGIVIMVIELIGRARRNGRRRAQST